MNSFFFSLYVYVHRRVGWSRCSCKTGLRNKQLKNPVKMLQTASNVIAFLKEVLSTQIPMSHPRFRWDKIYWYFHEIAIVAREESEVLNFDGEVVADSRSFHLISFVSMVDPIQLLVKYLECLHEPSPCTTLVVEEVGTQKSKSDISTDV